MNVKFKTLLFMAVMAILPFAGLKASVAPLSASNGKANITANLPGGHQLTLEEFLSLTPAKYKEMTGKKLGIKKSVELKLAQKFVKKQMKKGAADISQGLYIVLAILGFGWLAMGILDDWQGSDWIISLVLYILFYIPGLIFSLIKMSKYY